MRVTEEMLEAGTARLRQITHAYTQAEAEAIVLHIYGDMRAARPRKGKAKPVVDRERVAAAIYKVRGFDWNIAVRAPDVTERLLAEADAAIAAMGACSVPEEATDAMCGAAFGTATHRQTWRAMLKAWRDECQSKG